MNNIKCIKNIERNGYVIFYKNIVYHIVNKDCNIITTTCQETSFNITMDIESDYFKEHFEVI